MNGLDFENHLKQRVKFLSFKKAIVYS